MIAHGATGLHARRAKDRTRLTGPLRTFLFFLHALAWFIGRPISVNVFIKAQGSVPLGSFQVDCRAAVAPAQKPISKQHSDLTCRTQPAGAVACGLMLVRWRCRRLRGLTVRSTRLMAARSLSSHWTNFEMHSWFMLVHFSWASTCRNSCKLFGSRTVMTRVGSLSSGTGGPSTRSLASICWISPYSAGLFKFGQGFGRRVHLPDDATQALALRGKRSPSRDSGEKGFELLESLPAVCCPCRSPRTLSC